MKKVLKTVLAFGLAASLLSGCSQSAKQPEGQTYQAGTYTGISENGKGGKLALTMEFSDQAIISAEVTEHHETPNISDAPLEQIPQQIVDQQSLNIDVISGATITSDAILEAAADAVRQAGGDVEQLKQAANNTKKSEEVIDLTTDLVIVGAGAAGMAAAVSAADEGADSVVVFEKQANIGGNAIVSGGFIENLGLPEELKADNDAGYEARVLNALEEGPQSEEEAAVWDQFTAEVEAWKATDRTKVFDSPLWMAIEGVRTDGGNLEDYLYFAETLQEFDNWIEEMGVEWEKAHGIVGYSWPRWTNIKDFYLGEGYFHYLKKNIEENQYPIDIYTSTPVTELLVDEEGAVTGVHAVSADGTQYNVKARQGVLLATGGFAGNGKMLVEYNELWEGMTEDVLSTNTAGATGDGIVMAQKLGAAVDQMEAEMMFPMADRKTGSTEAIVGNTASCLMVNQEGQRFTNETGTRWDISAAIFEQTGDQGYIISSSNNSGIQDGRTQGGSDVEAMLKNGRLFRADTLEELAAQINVDPQALQATVKAYNEMTKTHEDPQFGRTTFEPNSEIAEGPYYAYPCVPAAHITIGGLVVDYDTMQVVKENGEAIPYLFAAGEVLAGECGIDGSFAQGKALAKQIVHNVAKRDLN